MVPFVIPIVSSNTRMLPIGTDHSHTPYFVLTQPEFSTLSSSLSYIYSVLPKFWISLIFNGLSVEYVVLSISCKIEHQ